MKIYLTENGLKSLESRLNEKIIQLKLLREEKAHAYHASGDGWHDNPGWIQIGQQEDQLVLEINEMQKRLNNSLIVTRPVFSDNKIRIGVSLSYQMINTKTHQLSTNAVTLGGIGESDIPKKIISSDSPIGKTLIGMKNGESKLINLPSGEFLITIKEVYYE